MPQDVADKLRNTLRLHRERFRDMIQHPGVRGRQLPGPEPSGPGEP
jgi:hypothetical protein